MPQFDPMIGGNFEENKTEERLESLLSNRAILILPTNDSADESPALKKCETIEEVFNAYKPTTNIPVEDAEGSVAEQRLQFKKVTDFAVENIVEAVPTLKVQKEELAVLTDLRMLIKDNPRLRKAVDKGGEREKLIACLQEALKLLESTKH